MFYAPSKSSRKLRENHHSMVGLMMWNPIDIPCFPIESHRYPPLYIYMHGCYIQYPIIHIIWSWTHHIPWFISFTMFHYYPIINVKYPNVISHRYPVEMGCSHPPFLLIRTVGLGLGLLPPTSGLGSPGEVGTRLERGVTFFFRGENHGEVNEKVMMVVKTSGTLYIV